MPEKNIFKNSAKIISRALNFDGYHRLETIVVQPRSLKHDGWAAPFDREVFSCKQVACVLPYIPETDEVLISQQFRLGAFIAGAESPFLTECAHGCMDEGENPEDAARREALEETGAVIGTLEFIGNCYSSPGCVAEKFHCYIGRAKQTEAGVYGLEEEGEEIRTRLIPAAELIRLLDEGHVTNVTIAFVMNYFARHKDRIRKKWLEENPGE